jgi:hypothetical protein
MLVNVNQFLRNHPSRVAAWLCVAGGAVALLLGYIGLYDALDTGEQLAYLVSGGIFGLFLLGLAAMLWLSSDLQDEWRKLDAVERHLQEGGDLPPPRPVKQHAS